MHESIACPIHASEHVLHLSVRQSLRTPRMDDVTMLDLGRVLYWVRCLPCVGARAFAQTLPPFEVCRNPREFALGHPSATVGKVRLEPASVCCCVAAGTGHMGRRLDAFGAVLDMLQAPACRGLAWPRCHGPAVPPRAARICGEAAAMAVTSTSVSVCDLYPGVEWQGNRCIEVVANGIAFLGWHGVGTPLAVDSSSLPSAQHNTNCCIVRGPNVLTARIPFVRLAFEASGSSTWQ